MYAYIKQPMIIIATKDLPNKNTWVITNYKCCIDAFGNNGNTLIL